jgi:alpha-tubulin suppressor-like RCC1 family protein
MAELRENTWSLDEWYDQNVAGTTGGYRFGGAMWIQGSGNVGRLLNLPSSTKISSPTQVGTDTSWKFVKFKTGIKRDGTLWTWGQGSNGQLGHNDRTDRSSPIQIGTETTWRYATGLDNGWGIKTDGTLWVWGYGTHGSLGLNQGGTQRISSPTQVGTDTTWATIANGDGSQHTLGTKTDGTLWSWGYNEDGVLGHNNRTNRSSPTQVGTDTSWSTNISDPAAMQTCDVGVGCEFAIKANGTLWTWGRNSDGQQGRGESTNVNYSSPVQVPGTTWRSIHAQNQGPGRRCVFATKTNGTLYAWGSNTYGGLGQNNRTQYSSPRQIPGTDWTSTTYGFTEKGGFQNIKTDGTYWTWGQNYMGPLGLNQSGYPNQKSRSSPTQVGTDATWFASGGFRDSLVWALKN